MCLSALKFHTHTDVQTEPGSPTSRELRLLLTVLRKEFMHVLVAFVPAKLHAPSDLKPKRLEAAFGSLFFILKSGRTQFTLLPEWASVSRDGELVL